MKCRKCNIELNESNSFPSQWKQYNWICKFCNREYSEKNKDRIKELHHQYYKLKHPEKKIRVPWNKGKSGIYSKETLDKMSRSQKGRIAWNKDTKKICKPNSGSFKKGQVPHNKIGTKREHILRMNTRRRLYGHDCLNQEFSNSEAHHIDINTVIWIPKEIHRMIIHNLKTKKNMEIINTYAYFFLVQNNIKQLSGVI